MTDPVPARVIDAAEADEDRAEETALRPKRIADFVGQPAVREQLAILIEAARKRGEALDHVLLHGDRKSVV